MAWWQWTGAACLLFVVAVFAVAARVSRYYSDHQMGLDWGPSPSGTRVPLDTANNRSDFEYWLRQHVEMELDFRGPGLLPFNRPPGTPVGEGDWTEWWLERLSYCDDEHYAHPELARWQIISARREAGLPELTAPESDREDQDSSGK
jgi:hypothetical protein